MKKTYIYTALLAISCAACSDWKEHYDDSVSSREAKATIWGNISSNANLTEFKDLLQKTGYDTILTASQTYTVWAPVNGSFGYDTLVNQSNSNIINKFILNHIARNSYPASGSINEEITMLNDKVEMFYGTGAYYIGGVEITQPNIPSLNGSLHAINGRMLFYPSIYEYLLEGKDSVSLYYQKYHSNTLNTSKSVQGPMINGEITYLDSVFDINNALWTKYGAEYINREDSNYTMIIPSSEAYNAKKEEISKYFNYPWRFTFYDAAKDSTYSSISLNSTYLNDSLTHYYLIRDLVFNNNLYNNEVLETKTTGESFDDIDSLMTVPKSKLYAYDAQYAFDGASRQTMSNGYIWTADYYPTLSWNSWAPIIKIEAETGSTRARNTYSDVQVVTVNSDNRSPEIQGQVSGDKYALATATGDAAQPHLFFNLPNVLSTTYIIKVVFVPTAITETGAKRLPTSVRMKIGYNDANGSLAEWPKGILPRYVTDSTKVDTVSIGEFTFPIAYQGTGYYPYMEIYFNKTNAQKVGQDVTNNLAIDCILLVPKELEEFMEENPDYILPSNNTYHP